MAIWSDRNVFSHSFIQEAKKRIGANDSNVNSSSPKTPTSHMHPKPDSDAKSSDLGITSLVQNSSVTGLDVNNTFVKFNNINITIKFLTIIFYRFKLFY